MEDKIKCPFCGSDSVAEFLYGMPCFSDELSRDIDEGKIILGGCCIDEDSPEYECSICHKQWSLNSQLPGESKE